MEYDASRGAPAAIRDAARGVTYAWNGISVRIRTDRGLLAPATVRAVEREASRLVFLFSEQGFDLRVIYDLSPGAHFIEKWFELHRPDGHPYVVDEVVLEDVALDAWIRDLHSHDDQTLWHCPINLFLRGEQGGCFAGLEYPYWTQETRASGFRLGYAPHYPAAGGEQFESEKFFVGVYGYEGISRRSHGPYPGPVKAPFLTLLNTGVYQQLSEATPGKPLPVCNANEEVLDWGEVWAMQAFMRHVLPAHDLPEEGYWTLVNAWWVWAYHPDWKLSASTLELLRDSGVHDLMTRELWFGHSEHPLMPDSLAALVPDAPLDFRATDELHALWDYGKRIGVHVSSFVAPPLSFTARPNWLSRNEKGQPSCYIGDVQASCPAVDEYMAFLLELHLHIFDRYQPRYWGFDGRWLSFRELPYSDGDIGFDPCYATGHGHPPGDNLYREWRNINRFLAALRQRYPRMCLETYYGLKRGGPWALRHLNATENYYESNGSDQNRFQQWHNQNDRFLPPDRNYSAVFGRTADDFRLSLLASLAGAPYCQVGAGLPQLDNPDIRAFFKQWRAWAGRHHRYLQVKRDLFGPPGYGRIDGSAHIIGDRGFLFLFPTGLQPNAHTPENDEGIRRQISTFTKTLRAAIRLNHWIGLEAEPGLRLQLTERYPREGAVLGAFACGDIFRYDMPPESAAVLEIEPATTTEIPLAAWDASLQPEQVYEAYAFEEWKKENGR